MAPTTTPARRIAPVTNAFWTKHNSDRSETQRSKCPAGTPNCAVCGAALNPTNATTVAIIDGGCNFLHVDDVTEADLNDPGFMGCWDLGSSCVRLAAARVRGPYQGGSVSA